MPKRIAPISLPTTGLNLTMESYLSDKVTLAGAYNMRPYKGAWHSCGVISASDTLTPASVPNGEFFFRTGQGDSATLLGTKDGFFRWNASTSSWDDVTGSATVTGADTDLWSFSNSWDAAYASNNVDGIFRYKGTGNWSLYNAEYNARYVVGFAGRVFLIDVSNNDGQFRDRVFWTSASTTPSFDILNGAGYNDLVDIQGPCTGGLPTAQALYIHKRNAIWRVTETGLREPALNFQIVYQGVGSIGGRTLQLTPLGQIFLGSDFNVYLFDGSSAPKPIGDPVATWLRDNLNAASIARVYGQVLPEVDEYWLCVPTGSDTWSDTVLIYNWKYGTWGKYHPSTDISVIGLRNTEESADTWGSETVLEWGSETAKTWDDPLLSGETLEPWFGRTTGATFELNLEAQSGTVTGGWNVETQDNPLERAGYDKTLLTVRLHGVFYTANAVTVTWSTDGGQTYDATGVSVTPGASPNTTRLNFNLGDNRVTAENIRFKISGTGPVKLYFMEVEVLDRTEVR